MRFQFKKRSLTIPNAEITQSDGTVVQVKKEEGTFDEDHEHQGESLPDMLEVNLKEEKVVDDSLDEHWLDRAMAEGQDSEDKEEEDNEDEEEEPSDLAASK